MKIIILSFQRQRKNRSEKAKREKEELAQEVERLKEQIALKGDSKFFMQKERKDKKFATCFSLHMFYCNAFFIAHRHCRGGESCCFYKFRGTLFLGFDYINKNFFFFFLFHNVLSPCRMHTLHPPPPLSTSMQIPPPPSESPSEMGKIFCFNKTRKNCLLENLNSNY